VTLGPLCQWQRTDPQTPIIVIASRDQHVMDTIAAVAARKFIPLRTAPVAPGQRAALRKLLLSAPAESIWVVLENGHLDVPFLETVPGLVGAGGGAGGANPHFRLFIMCKMCPEFPSSLLDVAVVQNASAPTGFKARLYTSVKWLDPTVFDALSEPEWPPLLFTLLYTHAMLEERARYGRRGWSGACDFHRSDLLHAVSFLRDALAAASARFRTATGHLQVASPPPYLSAPPRFPLTT